MKTTKHSPAHELINNSTDPIVVEIRNGNLSQNETFKALIPMIIDLAKSHRKSVVEAADKEVFDESLTELQRSTDVVEQAIYALTLQGLLYTSLHSYTKGMENFINNILKVSKIKS